MGLKRDSFEAAPNLVAQWMKSQLTAVSVAQQCLAMVSPVDVRDTKPYLVSQSVLWWLTCCWDGHFGLCYQSLCYKGRLSSICWCHPQKCCHVKWSLVEAGDVRHLLFFACTGPLTLAGNHNLRNFVAIYALFGCTIFSHPLWWFVVSWLWLFMTRSLGTPPAQGLTSE